MFTISGVVIFTACIIILFYFIVARFTGFREGWNTFLRVVRPFIIGFGMAFLMNPIMKFLEKHTQNFFLPRIKTAEKEAKAKRAIRVIDSILALVILTAIALMFMYAVIPELISTVRYLATHIEEQIYGVLDWANDITRGRYEDAIMGAKDAEVLQDALDTAVTYVQSYLNMDGQEEIVKTVTSTGYSIGRFFVDIIIGMIVSVYVLVSKETFKGQTKKLIYGIFRPRLGNDVMEILRKANAIFYGFIIGKIIDSIIIGFICYACVWIMDMPYKVLVSFIVGITNVIPVFGPYIGAVPTVIIIFLTEPMKGIYFLIFVFILQQVDGNIIGPKILGDSTGLSAFWVVVAIVIGGGLFGLPGMLLGVPTTALLYYLVSRWSKWMVEKQGLPPNTNEYVELDTVNVETKELIAKDPDREPEPILNFTKNAKDKIVQKRKKKAEDSDK